MQWIKDAGQILYHTLTRDTILNFSFKCYLEYFFILEVVRELISGMVLIGKNLLPS